MNMGISMSMSMSVNGNGNAHGNMDDTLNRNKFFGVQGGAIYR